MKKVKIFIPITLKLITITLFINLIIIGALSYQFITLYKNTTEKSLEENGRTEIIQVKQSIKNDLKFYLLANDIETKSSIKVFNLQPTINAFIRSNSTTLYLNIFDQNGNLIIGESGKNLIINTEYKDFIISSFSKININNTNNSLLKKIPLFEISKKLNFLDNVIISFFKLEPVIYNFYLPIPFNQVNNDKKFSGTIIHLGISNEQTILTLLENLYLIGSIILIIIAFSLIITLITSLHLSNPIRSLSLAVKALGKNKLSKKDKVKIKTNDEVALLAMNFNNSVDQIIKKKQIENSLGNSISQDISDFMINLDGNIPSSSRIVSTLFGDIRGFTKISSSMAPEDIVYLINTHFEIMTKTVNENLGLVDKYVGDEIMAVYGLWSREHLEEEEDYVRLACLTGMFIVNNLEKTNKLLQEEGYPSVKFGIGINTGKVNAGMIGSQFRSNYTVIGDTVNIAARLSAMAGKEGKTPLLLTEKSFNLCEPIIKNYTSMEVKIRGKEGSNRIYGVLQTVSDEEYLEILFEEIFFEKELIKKFKPLKCLSDMKIICRYISSLEHDNIKIKSIENFDIKNKTIVLKINENVLENHLVKIILKYEYFSYNIIGEFIKKDIFNFKTKKEFNLISFKIKKTTKQTIKAFLSLEDKN